MANRFVLLYKLAAGISNIQGSIQKGEPAMKWLPSFFSIIAMIATPLYPALQNVISAHPTVAVVVAGIVGIVSHLAPSPVKGE